MVGASDWMCPAEYDAEMDFGEWLFGLNVDSGGSVSPPSQCAEFPGNLVLTAFVILRADVPSRGT